MNNLFHERNTFGQQLRMVYFDWISPKDTCVKLLAFSVVALRGAIDIYGVIRPYRMCSLRVCETCPPGSKYESLAGTDTITLYQRTRCDHLLAHTPTISLHMGRSSLGLECPQWGVETIPKPLDKPHICYFIFMMKLDTSFLPPPTPILCLGVRGSNTKDSCMYEYSFRWGTAKPHWT